MSADLVDRLRQLALDIANERPVGNVIVLDAAAAIERMRDRTHSEEFVVMFLGYLTAKLPELHSVEAPRLMDAWNAFKLEMGKKVTR